MFKSQVCELNSDNNDAGVVLTMVETYIHIQQPIDLTWNSAT